MRYEFYKNIAYSKSLRIEIFKKIYLMHMNTFSEIIWTSKVGINIALIKKY